MTEIIRGHRLELKPEVRHLYEKAVPGMRGWAKNVKIDDYGFPLVYVQWDKDHWRYTGEEDGWTFQDHFNVIGYREPTSEELDKQKLKERQEYYDLVMEAAQAASDSDGFLMLTISENELGTLKFNETKIGAQSLPAWAVLKAIASQLNEL